MENFLLLSHFSVSEKKKIDNFSFRASGGFEIKIWTDSQMVAFLIQIIFMAAATGETEQRKTRTK